MSSAILRVSNTGGRLQLQIQQELARLRDHREPINMVSIFGEPRGGKSWLLGELSPSPGCFATAPGNAVPCTSGVNFCDRIVSLPEYSGTSAPLPTHIKLLFADCEGMGEHDIVYDTMLFCPMLLVSRAYILNWKGGLRKSEILSSLQTLVTIAQRFGVSSTQQLGHLYFVLRDADELDTSARVYSEIFDFDSDATLNLYRRSILDTFESVKVFCLPPPSDRFTMRRPDFCLADCDPDFQQLFAVMRLSLIRDLSTPRFVHNQPLTGPLMASSIAATVAALNDNATNVFPRSTAESLVSNIIAEELRTAEQEMNTARNRYPAIADPNAITTDLQRSLSVCVTQLQQRLVNYDQNRITTLIDSFRENQALLSSNLARTVSERISEMLNDCYRRSVTCIISAFQQSIAANDGIASAEVTRQCEACKQQCLAAFDNATAAQNIRIQWSIVRGHRVTVANELDSMLNKLRLGYERLTNQTSVFGRIIAAIYHRRFNVDVIPAIMAFNLNDNSAINDTTHGVLRSPALLQLLPQPPVNRMQELRSAVVDLMSLRADENPDSSTCRVLRKGLDALNDEQFLSIVQQCDTVHVTVRNVLLQVWEVMRHHIDKDEMTIRLCQELHDSRQAGHDNKVYVPASCAFHGCPGGIIARILNTLRGFCDVPGHPLDPSLRQGFLWAFSHRVFRSKTLDARLKEAELVMDEYGVLEDRESWLQGVRERGEEIDLDEPLMEELVEEDDDGNLIYSCRVNT